jgi:hypothetical protein
VTVYAFAPRVVGVTAALPPEAERAPDHEPAPAEAVEAAQDAALTAVQVRVDGWPRVTFDGEAERVTIGATSSITIVQSGGFTAPLRQATVHSG